jgi:hypothetical protein
MPTRPADNTKKKQDQICQCNNNLPSENRRTASSRNVVYVKVKKNKAIPVTGLGGLQDYEMSGIPYFIDNRPLMAVRLSDLRARRALLPERSSGTHFC